MTLIGKNEKIGIKISTKLEQKSLNLLKRKNLSFKAKEEQIRINGANICKEASLINSQQGVIPVFKFLKF
jgi:hypothetical protein